ncbi:hypothetical protein [Cellulomonas soli]|uniref:DUF1508 domain-containing protein n=1 Tax=Cellulomonas soli TaxID=931535 RepID=A0A512P9N3_9CELL|nr:hypothetical protein [Cellulomonas soli]NYI60406.1 hypothetical protein [Cellulomonas soli]GEP67919.1 hypothetical protein CSO01_06340 [Cellulomonas soli]
MVLRPQWEWRLEDGSGRVLGRPVSPVFTTQFDAEQWLGEQWRTLAGQGVQLARLVHEGVQAAPTVPIPGI